MVISDRKQAKLWSNRKEEYCRESIKVYSLGWPDWRACELVTHALQWWIYSSAMACGMVSRRYWRGFKVQYGFFWIARATSLSVKVVDGGWGEGRKGRGSKRCGFCEMCAKERFVGGDWSSLLPSPPEVKLIRCGTAWPAWYVPRTVHLQDATLCCTRTGRM